MWFWKKLAKFKKYVLGNCKVNFKDLKNYEIKINYKANFKDFESYEN